MMVWTPIPRTLVDETRSFLSGSVFDILWKALISTLVVGLGVVLILMGSVGGVIGAFLIMSLISDEIRGVVSDLWHRRFWNPALAVALLVLLATAGAPLTTPARASPSPSAIEDDHPLATSGAVETFDEEGFVTGSMVVPDVRFTIAESYDGETLSGTPDYDPAFVYLRVQYNETIPRTLRFYIPSEYWYPHPQNIQSEAGDVTAELRPLKGSEMTEVSVRTRGEMDAVFAVPLAASAIYVTRDMGRDVTENLTGITVPEFASKKPWKYVDERSLAGSNTTVGIAVDDRDYTIQYDEKGDGSERWIAVPQCDASVDGASSVCLFQKTGDEDVVYVLARENFNMTENPPPSIRYKFDAGPSATVRSIVDGAVVSVQRALDWVGGLFGGG